MNKKNIFFIIIIFFFLGSIPCFASPSDLYARTIYLSKVYPHQDGYHVKYLTQRLHVGETYIPMKWFSYQKDEETNEPIPPKAELIETSGPEVPYMLVFWEKGEFHHLLLYVHKNPNAASWGVIENAEGMSEKFNVETLKLEL